MNSILGGGMMIGGTILSGNAADRRKKYIEKIAETPGVDLKKVYSDTTDAGLAGLPDASRLASGFNESAQTDLMAALNRAIPGFSGLQAQRAGLVGDFLSGTLPQDVVRQIYRQGAGKAVGGGYAGSEFGRNLVARDLGLSSLDLVGRGLSEMPRLISSTPMPRMTQASDILNITGRDTANLRSKERSEYLDMMLTAAASPGSQDVWGKTLTDMGGAMMGGGGGGGGGGILGGGMGGMDMGSIMNMASMFSI